MKGYFQQRQASQKQEKVSNYSEVKAFWEEYTTYNGQFDPKHVIEEARSAFKNDQERVTEPLKLLNTDDLLRVITAIPIEKNTLSLLKKLHYDFAELICAYIVRTDHTLENPCESLIKLAQQYKFHRVCYANIDILKGNYLGFYRKWCKTNSELNKMGKLVQQVCKQHLFHPVSLNEAQNYYIRERWDNSVEALSSRGCCCA